MLVEVEMVVERDAKVLKHKYHRKDYENNMAKNDIWLKTEIIVYVLTLR